VVCYSRCASSSEASPPSHRDLARHSRAFFGDEMSKKDEILNCCRDQARNAGEIASLLQLDKTVVKITLLYCFKRGLVTREKRDRPAQVRGPKQEFFYLCQQS
jgi:predicted ArsR family transcriptional regulator